MERMRFGNWKNKRVQFFTLLSTFRIFVENVEI